MSRFPERSAAEAKDLWRGVIWALYMNDLRLRPFASAALRSGKRI